MIVLLKSIGFTGACGPWTYKNIVFSQRTINSPPVIKQGKILSDRIYTFSQEFSQNALVRKRYKL